MTSFYFMNAGDQRNVTFLQNNDEVLAFAFQNGALPYSLTGLTLNFVLKASAAASDGSGTTIVPVVASAALGELTVTIPRTLLTTAGTKFYRIDATTVGNVLGTLAYGVVSILPM